MGEQYTIPAACLQALGGLREEDPPALVMSERAGAASRWAWHPACTTWPQKLGPDDRILVCQSAAALLAVMLRRPDVKMVTEISHYNLAHWFVQEAIAAHGSDPGWTVEVRRG